MARRRRKRGWLAKSLCGVALGLGHPAVSLLAQEVPQRDPYSSQSPYYLESPTAPDVVSDAVAGASFTECGCDAMCSPCTPAWCDPVCRVPNFFGSFVGGGIRPGIPTTETLTFIGGGEGEVINNETLIIDPSFFPFAGPGGPYFLNTQVTGSFVGDSPYPANENIQFTSLVQANFPGASFANGTITLVSDDDPLAGGYILFNYLFNNGQETFVNLPNPAGGGLVGRNKYFENGSPIPRDRVYFFYNHVGSFQGLGNSFNVNRYVLGCEESFLENCLSAELRIPFASTANSDQVAGQNLAVDDAEFGNIGLAFKAVLYRTANFLTSVGMGLSLPTADDSRMLIDGESVVVIQNQTCLLQPMFGTVWAPNDQFYAQLGMQIDVDPSGNPVQVVSNGGGLTRAGVLTDQAYGYVSGAAGYWIYGNPQGNLTGVALQAELNGDFSFGNQDSIVTDSVTVTDLSRSVNPLNGTVGAILRFCERTNVSTGIQFPLTDDRLYDWNLIAQLNVSLQGVRNWRR